MIDQAQTTMNPKARLELYHKIDRLWVEDAAAMPLYQQIDLYGATKRMSWKARGDENIKGYDMAVKDAK
jgi:peptide/nickel transport system substrate-binding protein